PFVPTYQPTLDRALSHRSPACTPWSGSAACCSVVEITKLSDLDRAARPAKIQHPHGWWAGWPLGGLDRLASAQREQSRIPREACDRGRDDRRRRGRGLLPRSGSFPWVLWRGWGRRGVRQGAGDAFNAVITVCCQANLKSHGPERCRIQEFIG